MSKYDAIIIGGGHNGLTAAAVLGKKGKKVLLLEKRPILGGIAAGEEFHSGYRTTGLLHDTSNVRPYIIKELELEKHGLETEHHRPPVALLGKDGGIIKLSTEMATTTASIQQYSSSDAERYQSYEAFTQKVSKVINDLMDNPPPDIDIENLTMANLVVLAKKGMKLKGLGNATMMELLKVAPMCLADFLNEKFETDFLKAGLAAPGLYGSYAGPWSAYSTINLLLWECAAKYHVKGGPEALVQVLSKVAKTNGVEIRKDAAVEKIILDKKGRACGVRLVAGEEFESDIIGSSCTPKQTFLNLIEPFDLDYELNYWIEKTRGRGTTGKVNLAVNKAVALNGETVQYARTGNSFDEMEKAFDPVKYGEVTDAPFLDINIPTIANPALAPTGHSVVSILVHQIPYDVKEGWTEEAKQILYDNVVKELEIYSPGITQSIVGSEILSPADLENRYSLTDGHIYHGEHFVDQLLTRPIPSCTHYRTPIEGLYLCGSGSHPGGGITCAPGWMAAKEILD